MKEYHREHGRSSRFGDFTTPALQVICLSSGGGPAEDNVTGFLVRSQATRWSKGSILAVDAGSHLAAITRILENHFPLISAPPDALNGRTSTELLRPSSSSSSRSASSSSSPEPQFTTLTKGPFAGLRFPFETARANALHVVRECVATYLITHPHLDHLSAFAINTAAFHNTSRPKKLAALPSTVNAIKTHIFNDIIWPNLTDEDGGVGFVTFQRLAQGGNIAVGEGASKGYMEVCDGICVKGMKISHGHCARGSNGLYQRGSDVGLSDAAIYKFGSQSHEHAPPLSPRFKARTASISQLAQMSQPATPGYATRGATPAPGGDMGPRELVVDSTAYFIRDDATGRELLFFGDVEPDSLSLSPRTAQVWAEAAPKVASGALRGIFIECSYDDSQGDAVLFGHLAPRHLFKELCVLADMTNQRRQEAQEKRESRKRKRGQLHRNHHSVTSVPVIADEEIRSASRKRNKSADKPALLDAPLHDLFTLDSLPSTGPPSGAASDDGVDPLSRGDGDQTIAPNTSLPPPALIGIAPDREPPLAGLRIIVMHMKDTLRDGPLVGDSILQQLKEHDAALQAVNGFGLGCEFIISRAGETYSF